MSIRELTLNEQGLAYEVAASFFERLLTGRGYEMGFVPLKHLSAIEIESRRVLPGVFILVGVLIIIGSIVYGSINSYSYYNGWNDNAMGAGLIGGVLGLGLILVTLFWTKRRLAFHAEGVIILSVMSLPGQDALAYVNGYKRLTNPQMPNMPMP